ncbi:MAG: tripartite tricarboxylate transporter substrate binding protein [Rubritepida sp.]|nr:tripartite tricarboxylate transporter substrate binding protein [Rubritepida sp.]
MMHRRHLLAAAGASLLPTMGHSAVLPDGKQMRMVVPFPPGGQGDTVARLYSEALTAATGQSVLIDNRAGGNGVIGVEAIVRSPPDGSTVGLLNVAAFTFLPLMMARPSYDPARDLTVITRVASSTAVCVVTAERARQRGWTDFRALINWAKQPGNELSDGSSGNGSLAHLLIALVARRTGASILHAPYRGGAPAATDLLAGNLDMIFDFMPALMPHIQSGRLVALAVGSNGRSPIMPDVPSMAEFADLNLAEVDLQSWNALCGPAGLSRDIVSRLYEGFKLASASPLLAERLGASGLIAGVSDSATAVQDQIRHEMPMWREMVEVSGAKID